MAGIGDRRLDEVRNDSDNDKNKMITRIIIILE